MEDFLHKMIYFMLRMVELIYTNRHGFPILGGHIDWRVAFSEEPVHFNVG